MFLVNDKVDELALRSLAAGAMGGIGGAKLLELLVGPLRYPVGSLFCESKIFSRELFKDFEERKDNNLLQDTFEDFSDDSLVDIKDME